MKFITVVREMIMKSGEGHEIYHCCQRDDDEIR